MKFTDKDYAYLNGDLFSNGYDFALHDTEVYARMDKLIEIVRGKNCLHVGCCDHMPLIEDKIKQNKWLHGLLEAACDQVIGIDINKEAVAYVNQKHFASGAVYCADISSADFIHQIPDNPPPIDYVLLAEIIEHVDNPVLFLTKMKENMNQLDFHGEYLITVPNAFCMLRGGKYGHGIECINSDHKYWFTPYTIAKVMTAAGITPKNLWFVNYDRYAIQDAYQSDQLIISGTAEKAAYTKQATDQESIKKLEALIDAGEWAGALDFIASLPMETRREWQIQNLTGVVCAACGQFHEAENFFSSALDAAPDDPDVLYNLAYACAAQEKTKEAEDWLCRCDRLPNAAHLAEEIETLRRQLKAPIGGKVLMAAYYFPPLSGSGVFRSIKFAKYLPLFGWRPTVISTDRPPQYWSMRDDSQVAEIPAEAEVIRLPDKIGTGQETAVSKQRAEAILAFLRDILRRDPETDRLFSQIRQMPKGIGILLSGLCPALSWAYDAARYIEEHVDLKRFRVIYTTSAPYSAHLIGFYLKSKYGVPWVADYRDPWTNNPYLRPLDPENPKDSLFAALERLLLRHADCNLTIAEGTAESYRKRFQLPESKIVSITNGYDEADFADLTPPAEKTEKFTINYSGLLYTTQRDIRPVLEALGQLKAEKKLAPDCFCLRLVGNIVADNLQTARAYGLENNLIQTGYLSHKEALQANLNADLLLLLVGDETKFKHVYTGKFFEYLRSGRPVLALAPKDGTVARVLRETGHGEAFLSTQLGSIKAMILREYRKWQTKTSNEFLHSPKIERFERKVLTAQLAEVLESVSTKPTSQPADAVHGGGINERPLTAFEQKLSLPQDSLLQSASNETEITNRLSEEFFIQNYTYIWLKAMLQKGASLKTKGATLITGSSYGVNGIIEHLWNTSINCSASSQDLFYDFLCAKQIISHNLKARLFKRCFIVDGYYAAYHDLSLGERERELTIPTVYYPIFGDGHNWKNLQANNLWSSFEKVPDQQKIAGEKLAVAKMLKQGTFFSKYKQRGNTVFNLQDRAWHNIPEEERQAMGKFRAESHNKLLRNKTVLAENKEILKNYIHFLHLNDITPIFIIAPFTTEYNRYISVDMKESIADLIASVPEEIRFVDFNQFTCFEASDFVDTDHLSQKGAKKFSQFLVDMFGK